MSIAIVASNRDYSILIKRLEELLPNVVVEVYPNISDPEKVQMALAWYNQQGVWTEFPNLELISSLGAGVDHLIFDKTLPNIPVSRIVDVELAKEMRLFATMASLNYYKNLYYYLDQRQKNKWDNDKSLFRTLTVGVLGLGELGKDIASHLAQLGISVYGYSRTPKTIKDVECFSETKSELDAFLAKTNILICVLPLTPNTKEILDLSIFKKLKKPAFLVNVGRGLQLNEAD
ncbi:MAG: NAD(P)-dependent oxidoreductase, partial [Bacteroidota bacterium]